MSESAKEWTQLLSDWKEFLAVLAAVFASVLGGIIGPKWLQTVSWLLSIGLCLLAILIFKHIKRRKDLHEAQQARLKESKSKSQPLTAFRSLAPFEGRDPLPGGERKLEARTIATRIVSDDFRLGVVCGDTGCGKTSLLRTEVTRALREAGFIVTYVRNQRRLESVFSDPSIPLQRLMGEIDDLKKNYITAETQVLILDQFEEWFREYSEPNLRIVLGRFLRELTVQKNSLRVVCALRKESLIDFHDLADTYMEPLVGNNLFHIRNFTVDQAIDVIKECALIDGLNADDSFAQVVAHDLAEGGEVRPPELQVVCTYLAVSGGLQTSNYRKAGGTAGILAHYIQDALSSCRVFDVGARLLRALCDFPARAKQKPKTLSELTREVSFVDVVDRHPTLVAELLQHFVASRLVVEEQRRNENAFALMHDYLVNAVELATSDFSTKTEEANQLLRYYVAEERVVIPLRKLMFIRKFAEKRHLQQRGAKRAIRRSIIARGAWLAATVGAGVVFAAGLYLVFTAQPRWNGPTLRARHWGPEGSGAVGLEIISRGLVISGNWSIFDNGSGDQSIGTSSDGRKILNRVERESSDLTSEGSELFNSQKRDFNLSAPHIFLWDAKTANVLVKLNVNETSRVKLSSSGSLLLLGDSVVELSNQKIEVLPKQSLGESHFSGSDKWITWISLASETSETSTSWVNIYSVADRKVVQRIMIPTDSFSHHKLSGAGDRLLVLDDKQVSLYESASGKLIGTLKTDVAMRSDFIIDDGGSKICTFSYKDSDKSVIKLWSLDDGKLLNEYHWKRLVLGWLSPVPSLRFSSDGSHIIIRQYARYPETGAITILRTADLRPISELPFESVRRAEGDVEATYFWTEGASTRIWNGTRSDPLLLSAVLESTDKLVLDRNQKHAVIWKTGLQPAQVWDLSRNQRIAFLPHSNHLITVKFTVEGTAIMVVEEGDVMSLIDALTGLPIAERIPSSRVEQVYYDRECLRFHMWNQSGQVITYVKGRSYFGRFVPLGSCQ